MKNLEIILAAMIEKHMYLDKKGNHYEGDIYVDYQDKLHDDQVKEIMSADNKMEAFYEMLTEYVWQCEEYEFTEMLDTFRLHWNEEEHGDFQEVRYDIIDWMNDYVSFNFPYDHYLDTSVNVNIIVDSGDGDYDYTLNNFASYNAVRDNLEIDDESSLLWLVEQQGYTREHLENAIESGEYLDSEVLKSVHNESMNVTSHMNALAFFVKMTIKEYMDLVEGKKDITVAVGTSCGLYDCWMGAGGTLEITLEKDVVIPYQYAEIHVDGTRGYGIDEIYGMCDDFWTETIKF